MSYEKQYFFDKINMETILSVKFDLKKNQLLEPVLNTNLDHAARVMSSMPRAILSEATLCVAGENVLVRFIPNKVKSSQSLPQELQGNIHFNVITNNGQPQLIRHVTCPDVITVSDIKDVHFSGHSCQDMLQSCSEQARQLVSEGEMQDFAELHIVCNKLSLIYSSGNQAKDGQSLDSQRYVLKTQCRFMFPHVSKMEAILKMKSWIEQEKPEKGGLIACVEHLLQQFIHLSSLPYDDDCFILQSDGEMAELSFSHERGQEYFLFGGKKGVSMFPVKWGLY
ncbi:hypothetical protein COCON_G00178050 [Conger conger]|uniref:Uncharacterized protein n=1 Tax=Conger conger TaxID=82655 RepID=A0A9Q1HSP2_CONCO|nr:hypothetical protein COCON_G00178050 [Conger conger]